MTFQVFDGNKPAQFPDCKVDPSWNNSIFNSFEEAEKYALNWLGIHAPEKGTIQSDVPYDYSFCEIPCYLEIKKLCK